MEPFQERISKPYHFHHRSDRRAIDREAADKKCGACDRVQMLYREYTYVYVYGYNPKTTLHNVLVSVVTSAKLSGMVITIIPVEKHGYWYTVRKSMNKSVSCTSAANDSNSPDSTWDVVC